MKHLLTPLLISLLLALPCASHADGYTSLWKQYSAATAKDHPQTQLHILDRIRQKATSGGAYGQLLKARLLRAAVQTHISPDSLEAEVARLEAETAQTRDTVLQAVCASALGKIYQDHDELPDAASKSRQYFALSMARPDLLAAVKAHGYAPFAVEGIDSRVFYDDLLHVVGIEAGRWKTLHDWYLAHGNRAAACLCAFEVTQQDRRDDVGEVRKSRYLQTLDSLIRVYGDLDQCGEIAIERYHFMEQAQDASAEDRYNYINYALARWGSWPRMNILRNAMAQLTLPSYHVSLNGGVALPGRRHEVYVTGLTNVQDLTATVTLTGLNGDTRLDPTSKKDYEKIKKGLASSPAFTVTHHFYGVPSYKVVRDTIAIDPLPVGVYLVEFTTDNTQIAPERGLLFVSDVYTMVEKTADYRYRIAAVSATTGQPLPGASVKVYQDNDADASRSITLTTDGNGEATYTTGSRNGVAAIYTSTAADAAAPRASYWPSYAQWEPTTPQQTRVQLYTDRSLYRPGQTVHVALIATRNLSPTDEQVVKGEEITIDLLDANYKTVKQQKVTTDDYGTASADFALPSSGLTGRFSVRTNRSSASFRVEEYKRPTYEIVFDTVRTAYRAGDTVRVTGHARTYSGMAVQGARVSYTVRREPSRFWWWRGMGSRSVLQLAADTLFTDDKGAFTIAVPMSMPPMNKDDRQWYNFQVSAQVTDGAGESHEGETVLPLGSQSTVLTTTFPDKIQRDSLRSILFSYQNAGGQDIAGDVTYYIKGVAGSYTAKANLSAPLTGTFASLPSGRYTLMAQCGTDTLSHAFAVFSMADSRPAAHTPDWFYQSAEDFPADGSPVFVQVGSSDSIHVFYTVFAGGRLTDAGQFSQHDAVKTVRLNYKEEYGDRLLITYAWVRDGRLYTHSASIGKPLPDKRLTLRWTTFRDRLTPGQRETWTLHVERPEGWDAIGSHRDAAPAQAQLLAVLYDKSLDAIYRHSWSFSNVLYRAGISAPWTGRYATAFPDNLFGEMPYKSLAERNLDYTHWNTACFDLWSNSVTSYPQVMRLMRTNGSKALGKSGVMADMAMAAPEAAVSKSVKYKKADTSEETTEDNASDKEAAVAVRENLDETAFFYPHLETDAKGDIKLSFTLPQSVTTWKFMGLAHDKEANFGTIGGEAVAQKTVMVQPNLPRFVRRGDKAQVTARVMNSSARAVDGCATLLLLDPATEKVVLKTAKNYKVEPQATANVTMDVPTDGLDGALYIVRVLAEGRGYSDGEQHYLPVLPDREMVTNTLPFTQNTPGVKTVDLAKLTGGHRAKVTVEYTNNPSWLMIQALPYVSKTSDDNAVSLAAAYYANALGKDILSSSANIKATVSQWRNEQPAATMQSALEKNQELKNIVLNETPWVADADAEADQKRALVQFFDENQLRQRQDDVFGKLQKLQRADGSFSWWPGMPGSVRMTEAVAVMLTRLNVMTERQPQTADMLASAYSFLEKHVAQEVEMMKQNERKGMKNLTPSETACNFLYISALDGRKATADISYLISRLEQQPSRLTIYGKAKSAVILAKYGKAQRAGEYLESINQYTVYKEETGRYFDTPKAQYSWCDYRIPSQVAAIEAIKALTPDETARIAEMQRWLLQEKRTQQWDTPINTVDAVYAFFGEKGSALSAEAKLQSGPLAALSIDGKALELPQATAGLGYVKTTTEGAFHTFTADKTSEGTSWGAVYAQFYQPSADIAATAAGMKVTREIIKMGAAGAETATPSAAGHSSVTLRKGDKVKVRITITADRDYDFVQVSDRRAACMEPVNQLSGYRRGCYVAPKDNVTNYYYDGLSRGRHVVETEYYIDREGVYQTGTCTVQCAYSPEFSARDKAMQLVISNE